MAIGTQIELQEMLQFFVKVCMQRLELISVHVHIYNDGCGWPETREYEAADATPPAHYLSIPSQGNEHNWAENQDLIDLVAHDRSEPQLYQFANNAHFHRFCIPSHGTIILQPRVKIEPTILNALKPIFDRLANSCHASISHETLLREMIARESAERTLHHQSFHNAITDLPNRKKLVQMIEQDQFLCEDETQQNALLCLEIDNLRKTTSIMGHTLGDKIQQRFTQILRNLTREKDKVSQLDTNLFLISIDEPINDSHSLHEITKRLVDRIRSSVAEPLMVGSHPIMLSISAGYEVYTVLPCDPNQVIKHAEIATAESALLKSDEAILYCHAMQERVDNRNRKEAALKVAGKNNELALWWQPQYNAAQQLIGAEALLRWISPEWGFVSPGEFIPIAEESDLIEKIGDWVLETACLQLSHICARGLPEDFKKLSINVSARQLAHNGFANRMIKLMEEYKIPKGLLAIELTESTLVQSFDQTVALIRLLKEAGVDCSIDDFGTGYSSLSYLKKLPIQTIKIDQSFIRDIHLSEGDQAIAKTLLYLGKNLSKDIIAEGVETEEERDCLIDMGCDQFQGYFYDRPMPLEDLEERWYADKNALEKRA